MVAVEVVATFLVVVLAYAAYWIQHRRYQHGLFARMGIPYVQPHLIYGSMHVLRKPGTLTTDTMGEWMKKHGKIFGYYVGWKPTLVVVDLDLIKNILIRDFHNFSNRPKLVINAQPVMNTLVGLRDQRWKDVRSVLGPTFSMIKMKQMAGIMNEKINLLLKIIEEKSSAGEAVDVYSTFQGLTLDVISECALAMKTNCQREQNKDELFKAVREFLVNAVNPAVLLALYVPLFASFMSFVSNRLALSGRMTCMIVEHLKGVIAIRRRAASSGSVDVLQLMLDAAESRHSEAPSDETTKERNRHKLLSDEEIIANAWVFMLGGFETTASSLTYTAYLLATHPQEQERLYKEVCSVVKDRDGAALTYEDVQQMKYLDQVFSESLRLYPPVVTFISRESARDFQLGDLLVPKDLSVMVPIWQIHRDPELWPDPLTFDPERFSADNKASSTRHPMAYIPFGAGPRNCPGMRFAQLEAKLTIARMIKKFRLEVCEDTPVPLTLTIPTVTINPTKEVFIKAVVRGAVEE